MILIKIDSLSTQELRNIAQQEGVEDWDGLSRTDLISVLKDIYEEDDDVRETNDVNRKFLFGITDYRDIGKDVVGLPGVTELPDSYPNTEIHLLYKNPSWAYCYWSISPQDQQKLQDQMVANLELKITVEKNGEKGSFSIPVSLEDREWNVGLPTVGGGTCFCSLTVSVNGEELELAHSNSLELIESYWLEHPDEMLDNDNLFKIYLSLLTTKDGDLAPGPLVNEIIRNLEAEEKKRWKK